MCPGIKSVNIQDFFLTDQPSFLLWWWMSIFVELRTQGHIVSNHAQSVLYVGTVQGLPDDSFTLLAWWRFVVCPHSIKHLWLTSLCHYIKPHHCHCTSFYYSSILIFKKMNQQNFFDVKQILNSTKSIKNHAVNLVTQWRHSLRTEMTTVCTVKTDMSKADISKPG